MQRLRYAAERAKRTLSDQTEAFISVGELGDHREVTAAEPTSARHGAHPRLLRALAEPLTTRCLEVCRAVLG
jgi:molecular chaperone DnaK (HSP70)